MRVPANVEEITLTNDSGREVDSVQATCERCGHGTESYGTSEESIRRCLVLLREECPRGERNLYVSDEDCPAEPEMPFGKHKGQPLSKLPVSYLRWLQTIKLREPLRGNVRRELEGRSV